MPKIQKESLAGKQEVNYALFVGHKYKYFKEKWLAFFRIDSEITLNWKTIWKYPSFNLSAAIWGPIWFLYRKMYFIGFAWLYLIAIIPSFSYYTADNIMQNSLAVLLLSIFFNAKMLIWITMFLYANAIYLLHSHNTIQYLQQKNQNTETINYITSKGGTSMIFILYCFLLSIVWSMISGTFMYFIRWCDYTLSNSKEEIWQDFEDIFDFKANLNPKILDKTAPSKSNKHLDKSALEA